jgi:hypothetical protein
MKKTMTILAFLALTNCAYNPVIDTAGRSGTFESDQAKKITDDIQHCQELADKNTFRPYDSLQQVWSGYFHYASLGIIPKREWKYKERVQACLKGRGHSVIK